MVLAISGRSFTSALAAIGIFYLSFMILDRILSIIYSFNFQPYGPDMPPGFTIWGHAFNGSAAALGLFIAFKIYDHGVRRRMLFLRAFAIGTSLAVCALIPYMADSEHLAKNGQAATIPIYVAANDLYVFWRGLMTHKLLKSVRAKAIALGALFLSFLMVHFALYAPMYPEFYWS